MSRFLVRYTILSVTAVLLSGSVMAAEPLRWVKQPELTFDEKGKKWHATFELNAMTDVEVAIVDPRNKTVVRHLAAGLLGPKAPPPRVSNSRAQTLEWDGKDDYQVSVPKPESLALRVRAGMAVNLDQIAGGNPYLYVLGRHYDHNVWGINGLELKPDGKVYVLGHSSQLGPVALRQYDIDGNYQRTVFPPPAGKDANAMGGWGIHVRPDGTYMPRFNRLTDPSPGMTILDTGMGMARLLPTPEPDRLSAWMTGFDVEFRSTFETMTMNTDGTIPSRAQQMQGQLVKNPPLKTGDISRTPSPLGPVFTCLDPDGKSFYLSGIYGCARKRGSRYGRFLARRSGVEGRF